MTNCNKSNHNKQKTWHNQTKSIEKFSSNLATTFLSSDHSKSLNIKQDRQEEITTSSCQKIEYIKVLILMLQADIKNMMTSYDYEKICKLHPDTFMSSIYTTELNSQKLNELFLFR